MIDIKLLRENPQKFQQSAKDKGIKIDVEHVLELDNKFRGLDSMAQKLREERNRASSEKNIEKGKEIKLKLEKQENALRAVEQELKEWLYKIPNPAKKDVKVGKDERENQVVKTFGKITRFDFKPKDHLDLGTALGIIDIESAAKVSGTRFAYLKNDGVLLELALIQFAFDILIKEGFEPIIPPVLIKKEITEGLGYWQAGGHEDYFWINSGEGEGYYLIGTAEHSIIPMYKDKILNGKELPKRIVAFSSAFRREAGSYGKDTRGILRVHQFDKIEMVSLVKEGEDDKEQDYLLSLEEKFFKLLEIPYQILKMCTADTGFVQARKYDLEAWIPSENKFREMTSASTVTDFQSRRLNIKYQQGNEKKYAYVLNATGLAIGRTIIAILENYQQIDGSVKVPKVLQKYLGKSVIKQ